MLTDAHVKEIKELITELQHLQWGFSTRLERQREKEIRARFKEIVKEAEAND